MPGRAAERGAKYGPQCGKKQVKEVRKARKRANGLGISRKTPHAAQHTYAGRAGLPQKILGRFDSSTAASLHTRTDTQARIDAVENNTPFPKTKTHHDRSTKAPAPLLS